MLLVLGADGGVGVSAVQIGKVCGAIVIAVARGAEKVEFLRSLVVDHVVDLTKGCVTERIKRFLKAKKLKGVNVLYSPVVGKLTKETMKLLNWGAQILVIGFASGEIPLSLRILLFLRTGQFMGYTGEAIKYIDQLC